jgi:hypothetical protein
LFHIFGGVSVYDINCQFSPSTVRVRRRLSDIINESLMEGWMSLRMGESAESGEYSQVETNETGETTEEDTNSSE